MGLKPSLTLRPYGATYTNNMATAQTGASITRIALEDHKNSHGATTTNDMAILLRIAVKEMDPPHHHNNTVRAKARRDLAATEVGRARISQRGTDLIKPHLH